MSKARLALALGALMVAATVVFGFVSAPASARAPRTKLIVTNSSPATPVAGQTFTMEFQLQSLGAAQAMSSVGCYATAGGKAVPLLRQTTNGTTGTCSWAVPSAAAGKTFNGILAAQKSDSVWYYRGFDLSVR